MREWVGVRVGYFNFHFCLLFIIGLTERLVLKDGATCENFAPFSMDVTLSKDKSGQWEPKYVSISVKLVSQPKKEDTKAVKSDSKADAKSKKLSGTCLLKCLSHPSSHMYPSQTISH